MLTRAVCARWSRSLGIVAAMAASLAQGAQPLVTDDAAIIAPKTCQLEAWVLSNHDGRDYMAQPGCNVTGNLELSLGVGRARPNEADSTSLLQVQAKTVLFALDDGVWSFGAVGGAARDTGTPHGSSAFQVFHARALASWYPREDLEIDLNIGAANAHGQGTFALGGAAIQYTVLTNVQLLAEAFRAEPGPPRYQVGARFIIAPGRLEAYASYGNRFHGSSDHWFAIFGIRLQTAAFLP